MFREGSMRVATRLTPALSFFVLVCSTGWAQSQETPTKPHVPLAKTIGEPQATAPVPSLAVLNAAGAKLEGGKLVLSGVSPNTVVFADRPVRAAGHVTTSQFLMQWDEGKNSFALDPPNATISVIGTTPGKVDDAVVVLKAPRLEGTSLTFDVSVLEGSLSGATGPAALFIDAFAFRGGYGGGFAHAGGWGGGAVWHGGGYWHAPVYHGGWYGHPGYPAGALAAGAVMGAAVGAAAARPYYYPPPCGVYPYPPCY
jgi:hypothetical protein